ncbi:sel1 repeat family protein, partial [Martelella alba]
QQAADKGNSSALLELARAYQSGTGVPMDEAKAVDFFQQAADKGNSGALIALGQAYLTGTGVSQDGNKAVAYFTQAADRGNTGGMVALARAYNNGNGVRKNIPKASEWAAKAGETLSVGGLIAQRLIDPNGFVETVQDQLIEKAYYDGRANGRLTQSTITAINKLCSDNDIAQQCATGPLSPISIRAYAPFLK